MTDSDVKVPEIPPFSEFKEWLQALPDDHDFGPMDYSWACRCPVASFLEDRGGRASVSANFIHFLDGYSVPAPPDYARLIRDVDINGASSKAAVLRCLPQRRDDP